MKTFVQWLEAGDHTPWGVPRSNSPGSSNDSDRTLQHKNRKRRVAAIMEYLYEFDEIELQMLQSQLNQLTQANLRKAS